jgi:CRP-like cAMP-binding protein
MDAQQLEITVRAISHSQLLHGIDPKALEDLVRSAGRIEIPAGKAILEENGKVPGLFILVEGSAQVLKKGTSVTLMGRGSFFGEISLFGVSFSATADVIAKDKAVALTLTKAGLEQWGKKHPAAERTFLYRMCTELSRRLYSTSERL